MTLYIVRHASAGHRDGSDPHDGQRHLDAKGIRQAEAVAAHLRDQSITAILSSPYPRCVETVAPLAEALDLEVVTDKRLAEGTDITRSWKVLEAWAGHTAVLCSHGDVIPDLVRRNQNRGMHVPGSAGWSKGSVWTLEGWDGTRFAKGTFDKLRD
jgi:broad specificity phosphatase PhoE